MQEQELRQSGVPSPLLVLHPKPTFSLLRSLPPHTGPAGSEPWLESMSTKNKETRTVRHEDNFHFCELSVSQHWNGHESNPPAIATAQTVSVCLAAPQGPPQACQPLTVRVCSTVPIASSSRSSSMKGSKATPCQANRLPFMSTLKSADTSIGSSAKQSGP